MYRSRLVLFTAVGWPWPPHLTTNNIDFRGSDLKFKSGRDESRDVRTIEQAQKDGSAALSRRLSTFQSEEDLKLSRPRYELHETKTHIDTLVRRGRASTMLKNSTEF